MGRAARRTPLLWRHVICHFLACLMAVNKFAGLSFKILSKFLGQIFIQYKVRCHYGQISSKDMRFSVLFYQNLRKWPKKIHERLTWQFSSFFLSKITGAKYC